MDFYLRNKVSLSEECIWSKSLEYFLISVVHVYFLHEGHEGGRVFLMKHIAYEDKLLLNNFLLFFKGA